MSLESVRIVFFVWLSGFKISLPLDIAQVSVDHARERYNHMRGASFDAKFICYDAFNVIFNFCSFLIDRII